MRLQSIVGHVPAGISAVEWSPEQEILVITTKPDHDGGHLLLMTADWTAIVTEQLNPEDFGEMKAGVRKRRSFMAARAKRLQKQKHRYVYGVH